MPIPPGLELELAASTAGTGEDAAEVWVPASNSDFSGISDKHKKKSLLLTDWVIVCRKSVLNVWHVIYIV